MGDSEDPLMKVLEASIQKLRDKSDEHEKIRASVEYRSETDFLRRTISDFIHTLRVCEIAASRWEDFGKKYLLPRHFDDIVEAALTAQLAIENGALNPARRELRYMLEVSVNIAYVDEIRAKDSFEERIAYYRGKTVKKSNVDHVFELPFRLLGESKEEFASSVQSAWVRASNYVHLTKRRIDEKLRLREAGVTLGMETVEMFRDVVSEVHEACSIVVILTFETIGPSFTGDLLVNALDENDQWVFHGSGYIAAIDSYFDYKHERQKRLKEIGDRRAGRVKYPV